MSGISKEFSGVKALKSVNLNVKKGEILALVGENGAGKSTLMNILSGTYPYGSYSGTIKFEGETCEFHFIKDSEKKGIVIIHQELALIPYMSIAENIFLGNERERCGIVNWSATMFEAGTYLKKVSLNDNPATLIKDIGVGKQQLVEIARALAKEVRLLILDEPTAALNERDSMNLLNLLLELKNAGMTSIIISHKLNEVCYVADRVTVIRDGSTIETLERENGEFSEERIIKGMVGRDLTERFPKRESNVGDKFFEVDGWNVFHPIYTERMVVRDVSLNVRKGEVVGLYGLMGAGRTELAMSIFGKSYGYKISGRIKKDGKAVSMHSVVDAIKNRVAYIPEDRKELGLNLIGDIKMNVSIAGIQKIARHTLVDNDRDVLVAEEYCKKLNIKCSGIHQKAGNLSGGNQQKVVLAKWIFTEPDLLLLDEPTRGVDVGAKYEIYSIINRLVESGAGALFISSDLTEILGMCDRIYIMNEGRITGELTAKEATQAKIMQNIVSNQG